MDGCEESVWGTSINGELGIELMRWNPVEAVYAILALSDVSTHGLGVDACDLVRNYEQEEPVDTDVHGYYFVYGINRHFIILQPLELGICTDQSFGCGGLHPIRKDFRHCWVGLQGSVDLWLGCQELVASSDIVVPDRLELFSGQRYELSLSA